MSEQRPHQDQLRWTGLSIALFVIGLLILVPSGLRTGLGLTFGLSDPSMIGIVLTVAFCRSLSVPAWSMRDSNPAAAPEQGRPPPGPSFTAA